MQFHELQKKVIASMKYDNPKILICSGAKRAGKTWILIYAFIAQVAKYENKGYSFILGGAVGNLIDRIMYGYVIDFLDFKIFGYDYPIFNLADTFIVVGVFILIVSSFREVGDKNEVGSKKKC